MDGGRQADLVDARRRCRTPLGERGGDREKCERREGEQNGADRSGDRAATARGGARHAQRLTGGPPSRSRPREGGAVDANVAQKRLEELLSELKASAAVLQHSGVDTGELTTLDQHPADSGTSLADADREEASI